MKPLPAKPSSYVDGGSQWAVPQAAVDRWLADGSFATGATAYRAAMRHHAKGVAIITTGLQAPVGFCATSLASVSLEPPILAFTVGRGSASWPAVQAAKYVLVHLLAGDQADLAHRFGQRGAPRFGPDTRWHRDAFGLPVLEDVLACMVATPISHLPVGDHALVIGHVIASWHAPGSSPLIHVSGQFVPLAVPPGPAG
jgi:flavin reductase (DIM6/NTAB) family NADH-FMN oxidoreductase RutF